MGEEERISRSEHGKENKRVYLARVSTWNRYEEQALPSGCSTTITSIAPLSVAGLMEFQVLETAPDMERTYCILATRT